MAISLTMPALSPTMETGTLAKWLVNEGDVVESGTVLAEIETDKATMELESIDDGTVGKLFVADGAEAIPVGQLIAVILEDGEDASVIDNLELPTDANIVLPSTSSSLIVDEPVSKTAPSEVISLVPTTESEPVINPNNRILASPLAKRIAQQNGYDISKISGSGPRGRIIKRDVENYSNVINSTEKTTTIDPDGDASFDIIKLSNMRKTIAKRLTESKQNVPHFYLSVDIELDNLLLARKELNSLSDEYKISVNDFVIKSCAAALIKVPEANVQ